MMTVGENVQPLTVSDTTTNGMESCWIDYPHKPERINLPYYPPTSAAPWTAPQVDYEELESLRRENQWLREELDRLRGK